MTPGESIPRPAYWREGLSREHIVEGLKIMASSDRSAHEHVGISDGNLIVQYRDLLNAAARLIVESATDA